jgi:NodT family efflux transporter outer membrane factor (OMF) lipoprotein
MNSGMSLIRLLILSATILFISAGCKTQMDPSDLPVETPDRFTASGTDVIPDQWWTAFQDPELNAVIDSAMQSNFTLRTAWERLNAATATADREAGAFFPTLDASATGEVSRTRNDFRENETVDLGLSSVYELDIWGRIRSAVDAERFRAEATFYDYQATALTLSAQIARTWYRLADARSQLQLVRDQIETNQTVLELLKNRFEIGIIRGVDVLRQQQLLESTREQESYAESRVRVLENELAILTGRTPHNAMNVNPNLIEDLPTLPETGIPAELLQRRPDVKSSLARLQASDRDLASAISSQYPRFTIRGNASTAAESADDLFNNWALSLAGNLLAPLFQGGELRAEVDRNEAVRQQRLFEYGQNVLTAMREVEDALALETTQVRSIRHIERQLELANQSYRQLRVEYLNGGGNYLDVLTALEGIQQLRRDFLTARLILVEYRISLYLSLAGSFETERETKDSTISEAR